MAELVSRRYAADENVIPGATTSLAFHRSVAVAIGIAKYSDNSIPNLRTPVNDAKRLAQMLTDEHGYDEVFTLTTNVTLEQLRVFFTERLPTRIGSDDRLLIYFAGHGIALYGEDGPEGYLIPQDAHGDDRSTFIAMADLYGWLETLPCRHLLAILDCCFAGAFTWYRRRNVWLVDDTLYREHYARFIHEPAWQILTSAAYNQEALDVLAGKPIGERGESRSDGTLHSPFAYALFEALAGAGDLIPKGKGDGVVTATELYLYLRQVVEVQAEVQANHAQTPELWPFSRQKHGRGEYIFLVPGHGEPDLPPALPLSTANNPYRGLQSYDEEHAKLFFGRQALIEELAQRVESQPLIVVLGASGTGKSSLVKAGLVPFLKRDACDEGNTGDAVKATSAANADWCILNPLRPSETPLQMLAQVAATLAGASEKERKFTSIDAILTNVEAWLADYPSQRLLLVIDQFEELVTLCRDDKQRMKFQVILANLIAHYSESIHIILTLRTDFEPQFADSPLAGNWQKGRFIIPPMSQDELRTVIEGPASVRVLFFDPPKLVDLLINEVVQTPGALPLLSFTLEQLYLKYLRRQEATKVVGDTIERSLTQDDYDALGGVIGSLRTRADGEYTNLPEDVYRETMKRIMLRMVAVEGGELTGRRVPLAELVYPSGEENRRVREVIDRLVEARLLVSDSADADGDGVTDAYIEPAHDALVRAWDRLLRWKQSFAEYLPLQRSLTAAAIGWRNAQEEEKKGLLWNNNPRLPQLQEIILPAQYRNEQASNFIYTARQALWPPIKVVDEPTWLNQLETEFVQTSVVRRANVLKQIVMITLGVIIALAALTGLAETQRKEAEVARVTADANAAIAATREVEAKTERDSALKSESQLLVNQAREQLLVDPIGSISLTLEALPSDILTRPYLPEAESMLIQAVRTSQERGFLAFSSDKVSAQFNLTPELIKFGQSEVAIVADNVLYLVSNDLTSARPPYTSTANSGTAITNNFRGVAWGSDGQLLAFGGTEVGVWQNGAWPRHFDFSTISDLAQNLQPIACAHWQPVPGQTGVSDRVALCQGNHVWLWEPGNEELKQLEGIFTGRVLGADWASDGSLLAAWDEGSLQQAQSPTTTSAGSNEAQANNPSTNSLLSRSVWIGDIEGHTLINDINVQEAISSTGPISSADWSGNQLFATGTHSGTVTIWNVSNQPVISHTISICPGVVGIQFTGQYTLATWSTGGSLQIWNVKDRPTLLSPVQPCLNDASGVVAPKFLGDGSVLQIRNDGTAIYSEDGWGDKSIKLEGNGTNIVSAVLHKTENPFIEEHVYLATGGQAAQFAYGMLQSRTITHGRRSLCYVGIQEPVFAHTLMLSR